VVHYSRLEGEDDSCGCDSTVAAHILCRRPLSVSVVKEFGLFGTWAFDCTQPAGPANEHVSFALTSDGTVELRDSFGVDYDEMIYRVVEAKRVGAFRLAMHQVLTTDERIVLDTETLRTRDRIRNWSSRFSDGSGALVEDGRMLADEKLETAWMSRCDVRRASMSIPQSIGMGTSSKAKW
jgi:hypothetical protein